MKQALELNAVMEGASTRQDRSLSMRLSSSELSSEEKMMVMDLQGIPCLVTFKPLDGFTVTKEIKTELSKKTISERIRACIFVFYKQAGEPGEWEAFYNSEGEKIISQLKAKLKPI